MTDLIAFLNARLDEDEAAALAVSPDAREWHRCDPVNASDMVWEADSAEVRDGRGAIVVYDESAPTWQQAEHIARHDPSRVLREIAAMRRIVHRCERASTVPESVVSFTRGQDDGYRQACMDAVADLASVDSDHPDYRQKWAGDE